MISKFFFSTTRVTKPTSNNKTAIFMLNLGGPNSLSEVSPFLERFFSDSTVIRIPFGLGPYIGKLRGPAKVTKQYEAIGGQSPLLDWTQKQGEQLINALNNSSPTNAPYTYYPAFRYGLPLYNDQIKLCLSENPDLQTIILFSQYPQFSCTTAGNGIREALQTIKELEKTHKKEIQIKVIDRWFDEPQYIQAISSLLKADIEQQFPGVPAEKVLILFSAHSLPVQFVAEGDVYSQEIATTASLVASKLGNKHPHRVVWQSRVGFQEWLKPSTEHSLKQFSEQGWEHAILVPLGFTSDHLETLYELDLQYIKQAREKLKYKKIVRARSLNDEQIFIDNLEELVKKTLALQQRNYYSTNLKLRCPDCQIEECKLLNNI